MNSLKTISIAAALSTLAGYAQAEVLKPLQGISFHTDTKDAVAYYLADNGSCKAIITTVDKADYATARFEEAVEAHKTVLREIGDGKVLEIACQADAQTLTINLTATVAQH